MSSKNRLQLIVFLGALFLIVILYFAPISPKQEHVVPGKTGLSVNQKIDEAVKLVQGENPMQGIVLLREVLKEDSTNVLAHFYLGQFSVQSGQLDKAKDRFVKVIALDKENDYPSAYFYLGNIYANEGNYNQAIESFEKYKAVVSDTIALNSLNKLIEDIKSKIE